MSDGGDIFDNAHTAVFAAGQKPIKMPAEVQTMHKCLPGERKDNRHNSRRGHNADISEIPEQEGDPNMGECFACGKCVDVCPAGNIHSLTVKGGYPGLVWNIAKGAILAAVIYFLM